MISEKMYALGSKQSCIREIFEFGLKRKQQVGEENVFDYSLGNPSIPTHKQVDNTITTLIQTKNSLMLHGYTPAGGDKRAREAIAEDLNERYGMNISSNNLLLTCGAAAAVIASLKAIAVKDSEVIVIAPYFPEYPMYAESSGMKLVTVPADTEAFQIRFDELEKRNIRLSSANSINWGRLVPQIVYYFAAYAQLLKAGKIGYGDKVDFCVPTGNFGDILAGYYAKQMGLPVGKLICASNENNVLTDFLTTGTYTAKREFFKTTSPSMDILVSSNLERLLYHVTGSDAEVAGFMQQLAATGSYTVRPETLATIQQTFSCGWSSEDEVAGEIRSRYEKDGYLCDTHTAVAFHVAAQKKRQGVPMVVLSTASPFKFPRSVLSALGKAAPENDFEAMQQLEAATGHAAPASLAALRSKPERFDTVIAPAQIAEVALGYQA